MGQSVTYKILQEHLAEGVLSPGEEIGVRIDQTITQDATGTMSYLQFEALGIPRVKTELSVSYVDHNMLQTGFENADDHQFLQSIAAKYGILFSKPGNGICHQVHLERFAAPGRTLLGSDSHTPTAGGVGSLSMGAGGLDVAVAMGGGTFYLKAPHVLGVKLTGKLQDGVSAKDVILEVLRQIGVKGGVGKVLEYFGEGVDSLTVPDRATITNMGAETGATTSVFPSDAHTKKFLEQQGRAEVWQELAADGDATYDETIEINLTELEPLIAKPHSPGNVVKVRDVEGLAVQQVCVGSCTNSSFKDLMVVAALLKGKHVHSSLSMTVTPGSKQVYEEIALSGALTTFIESGARILESACGPCIGMGQAPASDSVSVRTFNRNFQGRSGTQSAQVYLSSPETAAACALTGKITDPRDLGSIPEIKWPEKYHVDDTMILKPSETPDEIEISRGPNIKALPLKEPLEDSLCGKVLLKLEDDVTTDHIMPAGAKILPLRSNLPAISEYVFCNVDADFVKRCKENKGGFILGGENYGQGSSREHAALAPMYLGVKAVLVKSFARIHKANLINFGIVPLEFVNKDDYDKIAQGDELEIPDVKDLIARGETKIMVKNKTQNTEIEMQHDLSPRLQKVLVAGGLLNYTKAQGAS